MAYSRVRPTRVWLTLEFHAEAPQATAIEGLAQGPYVAAGGGFEPATKCVESSNEPPRPTIHSIHLSIYLYVCLSVCMCVYLSLGAI